MSQNATAMQDMDIDLFLSTLKKEVASYRTPIVDLVEAQTRDPFKVLVATIISARTKDEVTADVCKRLFEKVHLPEDLASLEVEEIERLIYPAGFYRNKAKYLKALPEKLFTLFGGTVPDSVEELLKLPGVGRKTANLVVTVAFGKPAVCVDTHVHRIMNIWGYVNTRTPEQTEMELRKRLPQKWWLTFNSILVAFGQGTCRPVAPRCYQCPLEKHCPQIGVKPGRAPKRPRRGDGEAMRFISWNVNGLRAAVSKGFLESFAELDADIVALQEIRARAEQLDPKVRNIPGYHSWFHSAEKKGYSGVAVYSRLDPLKVTTGMGENGPDPEGRVITLEFPDFFFVNIYFPNAGRGLARLDYKLEFNRNLLEYLKALKEKKGVVACGDFNVAHTPIDLANPDSNEGNAGYTPEERAWMDTFLEAGFTDTFRMFNSEGGHYTWWSYRFNARSRNIGWRIDYFCVDSKSRNRVAGAAILDHVTGSDHCPVELLFKKTG